MKADDYDPFPHDAGMAELNQRDLRNLATPIHEPVVQHVDRLAAEDENSAPDAGDGDFAREADAYVAKQIEDRDALLRGDDDEPLVDNMAPDESGDDLSPVDGFGNVAPEHAIEKDADHVGDFDPLTHQGVGEVTPADRPEGDDGSEDGEK